MKVFKTGKGENETQVVAAISAFCADTAKSRKNTSSGLSASAQLAVERDDVAQLPVIVELAESSPSSAKEAVRAVRKQIDSKHASSSVSQYRGIMVLRILVDTNSPTVWTQIGADTKLAGVVRDVFRHTRDPSIRELLSDALRHIASAYGAVPELRELNHLYARYVDKATNSVVSSQKIEDVIEEAKSSASLLQQVLLTTPPAQLPGSPLVLEFYDLCTRLQTKIQSYLSRDAIPPLTESATMNLISASDTIESALEAHKNAMDKASNLVSPPREYYEQQSELPHDLMQKTRNLEIAAKDMDYTNVAKEVPADSEQYLPKPVVDAFADDDLYDTK